MPYLPKSSLGGTENFFVWVNRLDYIFLSCLSMGLIQFRFFPSTKTLARFINTENIATRAVGNLASDKSAYLKKYSWLTHNGPMTWLACPSAQYEFESS